MAQALLSYVGQRGTTMPISSHHITPHHEEADVVLWRFVSMIVVILLTLSLGMLLAR